MDKLHAVKNGKQAQGQKEFINYLQGGRMTLRQAVKAHCYDCMGYYEDGRVDCELKDCPLHTFMPYNPIKHKTRVLSDAQREVHKARFASHRKQQAIVSEVK